MLSLRYESHKMFIHQKGLLFVLLYFLLGIGSLLIFDTPVNPEMEWNRTSYSYYLNKVQGQCNAKTDTFMSKEASKISEANSSLQKTYDDYYNNKLTEEAFKARVNSLEAVVRHQKGFEIIYAQYLQVRENTNNRFLLYTNGWNGLLSNDSLVLLLMVLITPVFCYEYESKMDSLILTASKGAKHNTLCKAALVLLTVFTICILNSVTRYAFC